MILPNINQDKLSNSDRRPLRTLVELPQYETQRQKILSLEQLKLLDGVLIEITAKMAQSPQEFPLKAKTSTLRFVRVEKSEVIQAFVIEFTYDEQFVYLENLILQP
jgi:hypothetical protein